MKKIFLFFIMCVFLVACGGRVVKVTLFFDSNGGSDVSSIETDGKSLINMPADPTKEDFSFEGWYWDNETFQKPFTANSLLDEPVTNDITVYAKWEKIIKVDEEFTVIFNGNGGILISGEETQLIKKGGAAVAPVYEKEGYSLTWDKQLENISKSQTINAIWTANANVAYKVEYYLQNLNDDNFTLNEDLIENNTGLVDTTVVVVSKAIEHFTLKNELSTLSGIITSDGSLVLKAYYTRDSYTITFEDNSGTFVSGAEKQTIRYQGSAIAPVYEKPGYTLSWDKPFNNITQAQTIKAVWTVNTNTPYKVEYYLQNLDDNNYTPKEELTEVKTGTTDTTVSVVSKSIEHFSFKIELSTLSGNLSGNGDLILKLYYERDSYLVAFNGSGGTLISGDESQTIKYQGTAISPVYEKQGYLLSWDKSFDNINQAQTINAVWTAKTNTPYKVEYYLQNLDNDEYTLKGDFTENKIGITDATASVISKSIQHFTLNDELSILSGIIASDGSLVLKVYYTRDSYLITFNGSGGTLVSGDETQIIKYQGTAIAPVFEKEGHVLIWDAPLANISEAKTINAVWTANTYLTYKVEYYLQDPDTEEYVIDEDLTEIKTGIIETAEPIIPEFIEQYAFLRFTISSEIVSGSGSLTLKLYYFCHTGGLEYKLSDDKTYYILIGTGGMTHTNIFIPSEYNGLPVMEIADNVFRQTSIEYVKIPNSITKIGNSVFYNCESLKTVFFAENSQLTSMGYSVFAQCGALKTINLSVDTQLTSIGNNTFYFCSSLTSITIPDSVTSINYGAFSYCISMTAVNISENSQLTIIDFEAFASCKNMYSITIPTNVTSINNTAFHYCHKLVHITNLSGLAASYFPNNHELEIRTSTETPFNNILTTDIEGLTTYTVDDKVYLLNSKRHDSILDLSNKNITAIYDYALASRENLNEVIIPDSVTSIRARALFDCPNLTTITFGENSQLKSIGDYAFQGCGSLAIINIPENISSVGGYAFSETPWYNSQPSGLIYIGKVLYEYKGGITQDTSIIIETGTISISSNAFRSKEGLIAVVLPDSLVSIGKDAFNYCKKLTSINIPDNVTSIGDSAFAYCEKLNTITIGQNSQLNSIGNSAFYGCFILNEFTIPANVTSIGNSIFDRCFTLVQISNLSGLTINNLPNNLGLEIRTSLATAFNNTITKHTDGAITYKIGNAVYAIGYIGSNGNLNLSNKNITKIYDYAFYYNNTFTSINFGQNSLITHIGNYAFYLSSGITTITIPASVKVIGNYGFNNCNNLTSITFETNSQLTTIGDYGFLDCKKLPAIIIPASVTSIGLSAFLRCTALTSVTFMNTVGWYYTSTKGATSGTNVNVTNPQANAIYIRDNYRNVYWYRN